MLFFPFTAFNIHMSFLARSSHQHSSYIPINVGPETKLAVSIKHFYKMNITKQVLFIVYKRILMEKQCLSI